ncbi:MAG: hypothetical protein ABSB69_19635 [Solirubrobacteraceae bacterium]
MGGGNAAAARAARRSPWHGTVTLDCDALKVHGSDLNVIVYTAPSGSSDADSLALLAAIGLQSFSG